jgi:hypothetical protein
VEILKLCVLFKFVFSEIFQFFGLFVYGLVGLQFCHVLMMHPISVGFELLMVNIKITVPVYQTTWRCIP